MALFNVLFDIAARTANIESALTNVERKFDSVAGYAKRAGELIGLAFGAEMIREGIKGAIELGDEMGKLADKTGLTASAASQLSNVFKQNDLGNEQLTAAFKNMQVALSNGSDAFGKLGLSINTLKNESADKAFEDIADAISKLPNAADRAARSVDIFKKSGSELLPVIIQGKQGIEEMRKELGGLSDEDVKQLQDADDAIKKIGFLKQSFWNNVAVGVVNVAEKFGLLAPSLQSQLNKVGDQIKQASKDVESENGAGAFSTWFYGKEGEQSLLNAKLRLNGLMEQADSLKKQIDAPIKKAADDKAQQAKTEEVARKAEEAAKAHELQLKSEADFAKMLEDLNKRTQTVQEKKLADDTAFYEAITALRKIGPSKGGIDFFEAIDRSSENFGKTIENTSTQTADFSSALAKMADNSDAVQASFEALSFSIDPDAIGKPLIRMADDTKAWSQEMNRSMTAAFSDAFYNIGTGANSFASDMINAFKRVLANQATTQLFGLLAGTGEKQGNGTWWGGLLSSIFGGKSSGTSYGNIDPVALTSTPHRAMGGAVAGGMLYQVNERGPEYFMPSTSGTIIPNHALGGGGGAFNYSPTFTINGSGLNQHQLSSAMQQTSAATLAQVMRMKKQGIL